MPARPAFATRHRRHRPQLHRPPHGPGWRWLPGVLFAVGVVLLSLG